MTDLGQTITVTVTVTGSNGFSGPVTITPSGIDPTWTVTAPTTPMTLSLNGMGTAIYTIDVPTESTSLTASMKFAATATGVTESDATSAVTVNNQYTIHIKAGTGTGTHTGTFPSTLKVKLGTKLIVANDDTVVHRIHGNAGGGNTGVTHEPNDLQPGTTYALIYDGSDTIYCHDHGQGTGSIKLTAD